MQRRWWPQAFIWSAASFRCLLPKRWSSRMGGITLFVAATIAIVMNDIKKVLAYSTVSQLGYMMLALGIGGWVAGLLHLLTHAFFKALLFLGSGSVIHGCHHEQDMRRMGGLLKKMPITAYTMLVGVLAIAGTPFFSGWYSKDAIIAQGLAFGTVFNRHILLLALPLVTAGITCFYMFRMWFLTFMGSPKDQHITSMHTVFQTDDRAVDLARHFTSAWQG